MTDRAREDTQRLLLEKKPSDKRVHEKEGTIQGTRKVARNLARREDLPIASKVGSPDSLAQAHTISRAALIELVEGLAGGNSVGDRSAEGGASIAGLLNNLGDKDLERHAVLDWAIQELRQAADGAREIVAERRNLLGDMEVLEQRIDRTQQETARIIGGFIKG